jgi:hypothetical protein
MEFCILAIMAKFPLHHNIAFYLVLYNKSPIKASESTVLYAIY